MKTALARAAEWLSRSYSEQPIENLDRWMEVGQYGGYGGDTVGGKRALSLPAAYACIQLLSRVASVLPGGVYRRAEDGSGDRQIDANHYLFPIVHDHANPVNSAGEWRAMVSANLDGWGNHYSWIEWDRRPIPLAFWPLPPESVQVKRDTPSSMPRYFLRDAKSGEWVEFPGEDILHVRELGDGTVGYSPVQLMAETLGLAFSEQASAANLQRNGVTSRLVLEYAGSASPEQIEKLRESIHKATTGTNQWKALVLQAGFTAKPISINPRDAQFIEQQKYSDEKVYQIFGTPPHLVGDTEKATSWGTGIEQLTIGYVNFRVLPRMNLIETAIERKILPERTPHFVEYEVKGLLKGDIAARAAWHKNMIEIGAYSPNRVLRAENEQPYDAETYTDDRSNTAFVDATGKVISFTPAGGNDAPDATE